MTAFELYYRASAQFAAAQHPVLETNDEKRYLHGRCIANYEKVIELAPYPIERVEIPFEGVELQCNFHMVPGKPKAPTVIFIPGCDMTKEMYPDPQVNHALVRGMHLLVDGWARPGHEQSSRHEADRGQLRALGDRRREMAAGPQGSRPRQDHGLLPVDGIALGPRRRGDGRPDHQGECRRLGVLSRQVLHPRHVLAALQAALRLSHRRQERGRARQDRRAR